MSEIPEAEMGRSGFPGRGLEYAQPQPDGTIECFCDCGQTTILQIEGTVHCEQEVAFTCGGCGSAHWVTLYPVVAS